MFSLLGFFMVLAAIPSSLMAQNNVTCFTPGPTGLNAAHCYRALRNIVYDSNGRLDSLSSTAFTWHKTCVVSQDRTMAWARLQYSHKSAVRAPTGHLFLEPTVQCVLMNWSVMIYPQNQKMARSHGDGHCEYLRPTGEWEEFESMRTEPRHRCIPPRCKMSTRLTSPCANANSAPINPTTVYCEFTYHVQPSFLKKPNQDNQRCSFSSLHIWEFHCPKRSAGNLPGYSGQLHSEYYGLFHVTTPSSWRLRCHRHAAPCLCREGSPLFSLIIFHSSTLYSSHSEVQSSLKRILKQCGSHVGPCSPIMCMSANTTSDLYKLFILAIKNLPQWRDRRQQWRCSSLHSRVEQLLKSCRNHLHLPASISCLEATMSP
ncbi:hypothetical protein VP01_307g1 [Puccinia sorghi]|uniref:Uncharacterized protein n=1 Tax=Puccinia sorghi TaxID=27349 RepID=A0A0L6V0H5_9BASI|nr:hypothetical protein VP01_307g1 [Puccinia sorghi]